MILTRAAQAAAAGKTARSAVKRVAVVLSGSGVYDGSEVHEASAVLVALGRNSALSQVSPSHYATYESMLWISLFPHRRTQTTVLIAHIIFAPQ